MHGRSRMTTDPRGAGGQDSSICFSPVLKVDKDATRNKRCGVNTQKQSIRHTTYESTAATTYVLARYFHQAGYKVPSDCMPVSEGIKRKRYMLTERAVYIVSNGALATDDHSRPLAFQAVFSFIDQRSVGDRDDV